MLIKDYPITNKRRDLVVDIEIEDVQWDNDSIGWYEYCGHMEYDHQPDYISEFVIKDIYYNDKKIHHKKILKFLIDKLYEDERLRERIEEIAKNDIEVDKYERLIDNREYEARGI